MLKWKRMMAVAICAFAVAPLLHAQADKQSKDSQEAKPQAQAAPATPAAPPAANPADVNSIDAIMASTYAVISGPAGQQRDWNRFRSLFIPGARLVAGGPKKEGGYFVRAITPDEYAQFADAYFQKESFFERESARHMDRYGNIVQIFSTYESRHDPKDAKPFARGINSFQLFYDGTRWWVVTIYWQEETPDMPLPKEFLPATK
jgi:hypothetical protein